jgi:hypothetical protein
MISPANAAALGIVFVVVYVAVVVFVLACQGLITAALLRIARAQLSRAALAELEAKLAKRRLEIEFYANSSPDPNADFTSERQR